MIPSAAKPAGIASLLLFHSGEIRFSSAKHGEGKQKAKANCVDNSVTLTYRACRSGVSRGGNRKRCLWAQTVSIHRVVWSFREAIHAFHQMPAFYFCMVIPSVIYSFVIATKKMLKLAPNEMHEVHLWIVQVLNTSIRKIWKKPGVQTHCVCVYVWIWVCICIYHMYILLHIHTVEEWKCLIDSGGQHFKDMAKAVVPYSPRELLVSVTDWEVMTFSQVSHCC